MCWFDVTGVIYLGVDALSPAGGARDVRHAANRLRQVWDRTRESVRRASRHDLVLAVIPAAFLVSALFGAVLSVDWTAVVTAAAGLSALAVFDALFLNPPRGPDAHGPPF